MRLEQRIKRLEQAAGMKKAPITFKLIFFGESDGMPKEPFIYGNVTIEPVLYENVRPNRCSDVI